MQPKFPIEVNGQKVCDYIADFEYVEYVKGPDPQKPWVGAEHKRIVEDVKGMKTDVYKLKKKLVKAVHGVEIQEI